MIVPSAHELVQRLHPYKDHVTFWFGCSAIAERHRPVLGFCFSFPVDHQALDAGTLIQWTKGFENPGGVGADPAKLLRQAFERQARFRPPVKRKHALHAHIYLHIVFMQRWNCAAFEQYMHFW